MTNATPNIFSQEESFTAHPLLKVIWEKIKNEGWNLDQESLEVKNTDTALENLKNAWHLARNLNERTPLFDAAKIIEKIQIHVTNAQRLFFITHTPLSKKIFQTMKQLMFTTREIFYEIKGKRAA